MIGVLGKGNRYHLHKSARHKTAKSCNRNKQDNRTLLTLLKTVGGNQETLAFVHVWVSDHADHHKNTSLIKSIALSESTFKFSSLKFQANIFLKNYLKVESKLLADLKYPPRNYGFT